MPNTSTLPKERVARPSAKPTRDRIVAAATDLFSERSFDGATTREIATRAGVTQPLLNYHFRSKEELWQAAVDSLFELLNQTLDERTTGLRGVDEVTSAKLLVREFVTFSARHPQLHRIIMQESKADGRRMDYLVDRHVRPIYEATTDLFEALARPWRGPAHPRGAPVLHPHRRRSDHVRACTGVPKAELAQSVRRRCRRSARRRGLPAPVRKCLTTRDCRRCLGSRLPCQPATLATHETFFGRPTVVVTRYVIDPLTLLQLASGTDGGVNPAHRLVAPNAIRSQALNLLLHRVRDGVLSEKEALDVHERVTQLKMRLLGDRVSRRTAWQIAREHNWTTIFDAEYIAVTKLQADALVPIDAELAARASGIVPLAPFADLFAD